MADDDKGDEPLVRVTALSLPYAAEETINFSLRTGDVVWLKGPSGVGKTTICSSLVTPDPRITVEWRNDLQETERCGALFQETTLVDGLCLGANVLLALGSQDLKEAKRLVEAVGLSWHRDSLKMPTELSGGMARRGAVALQLALKKRVVLLDEPFTGLPYHTASQIATELKEQLLQDTAIVVVSHRPDLVHKLSEKTIDVELTPRAEENHGLENVRPTSRLNAGLFSSRFRSRFQDYFWFSAPLLLLAFFAAGLAVATLSADLLVRLDAGPYVSKFVDADILPFVDTLMKTAAKDNPLQVAMTKALVRTKAQSLTSHAMPPAKQNVFARGVTTLFVLELGPLLAGLLFAGRIGGAYSGDVATMQATRQNDLLNTLGVSSRRWSLLPALCAAILAAPLLTAAGTAEAIVIAHAIGQRRLEVPLDNDDWFWPRVRETILPPLDLGGSVWTTSILRLSTWPPCFHLLKSLTYILIVIAAAELAARAPRLAPRDVPRAVTLAVVSASLVIILADFLFSHLLILGTHS